eukprot:gene10290-12042_t
MNLPPSGPLGHKEVSPRKKKGQISFATNSFLSSLELGSLDEPNTKKVAEDVQFLYSQLQRAKKDRETMLERCDSLDSQLQTVHRQFKEASTRRQLEEDAFRSQLSTAKVQFDRKMVKLTIKAKDREDLLLDWVNTIRDLQLDDEHDSLAELVARSLQLLPPSLRDILSRGRGDSRPGGMRTTSRAKRRVKSPRSGARSTQPSTSNPTTTSTKSKVTHTHTHAHHSAASTDPDALLAIISESMNVLDNFNLKETDDEVSDSEHLKGHYEDYLSSENEYTGDEGRKGNKNKLVYMTKNSPSRHYSGLAAHPKVISQQQNAPEEVEEVKRTVRSPSNKRRTGSPGKKKRNSQDDGDSDAGTVTGSIMDFNEAASDEEKEPHRALLGYPEHNNNTMGLSHHDSDPHNLRSADTHYPTATTHAHTNHPSHPLQLQDSYGTAVRSATKLLADGTTSEGQEDGATGVLSTEEGDDVNDEQFLETMRNLQDLALNSKHPNSSSEKRRMSESAVNYTNMVRNILDSMSELSKSIGQDGDSSLVNGSGIGAEIDGLCISHKNTTTTAGDDKEETYGKSALDNTTLSNTLRNAGVGVERVDSVTGIVGAVRIGSDEENYANASTFDQLLAEAGVTLDAMSLLSSDDPLKQGSHSQYTQGTIGAYEPSMSQVLQEVTGPANKSEYSEDFYHSKDLKSQFNDAAASDHGSATSDNEPKIYDDADIVRLIHTSTTGGGSPKGEKKSKKKSKVKSPKGSKVLIPGSISDVEIPVLSSSQLDFLDPVTADSATEQPKKAKKKKSEYSDSEQNRQVAELMNNISINNGSVESAENGGSTSRTKVSKSKMAAAGARTVNNNNISNKSGSKHNASEYSFTFESDHGASIDIGQSINSAASQQQADKGSIKPRHRIGAGEEDSQYLKLGGEWDSQSENTEYSHSKNTKKRY